MERHFTYFQQYFPGGYGSFGASLEKLTFACLLAMLMLVVSYVAIKPVKQRINNFIVPQMRFSLFGAIDLCLEAFVSFHDSILGKHNRKYIPLHGTIFFFILFANLIGLIPGMPAITTTVWVNVGIALIAYIAFNFYGIKENGIGGYVKHLCGPVAALGILLLPIEVVSHLLRILTLNLRLYWNISADHLILEVFTNLTHGIPVLFYFMGAFVSFMQAFVFTFLSMIYILVATAHEEH